MKEWFKDNLMSSLSLGAIVLAAVWFGQSQGLWFTSVENRVYTEKTIKDLDPIKMYGEYIMDSIEEVNTQRWRRQQMIHDSIQDIQFKKIDSLLRLNIRITDETRKKIGE